MRIGVDACCWANRRGYGRFTRELLTAVLDSDRQNQYWFFADVETVQSSSFPAQATIIPVFTGISPVKAASSSGRRSIADLWAMTNAVRKQDLDLFFFPASYSFFPILNRTPVVLTIHDALAETYPQTVFPNKKLFLFWKAKHWFAVKQADAVITVSDHSKKQIVKHYPIPESKIQVIPEAPKKIFLTDPAEDAVHRVLQNFGIQRNERFLLYVGGISPHKNLRKLVEVFHQLIQHPDFDDLKLILVGDYQTDPFYSDYPILSTIIKEKGIESRVVFTGYVEDEDLVCIYKAALLCVLPSLEEGFGLPALEAMACGVPVAVSRRGSLPEVVGEAGVLFDPEDAGDMLKVLDHTIRNSHDRKRMITNGKERAAKFDWGEASKVILSVFSTLGKQR